MKNTEKLQNIYLAARLSPLNADQHDAIRKMAEELMPILDEADKKEETKLSSK
jgi:hypothetical protein